MTKQLEALRMPERIHRDWNSAVMRTCESCDSWHMTVIHTDGSAMCAGCCDAYYTDQLKEELTAALRRIAELEASPLAVKLPESFYPDGDIDCPKVVEVEEVIEAIRAAGGTVEGE
ncbi:hypothetical protein [Cedecea sp. VD19]|uniref:hypothetical protein n=2 Tax=Cedecea TaxID=158483 RepID=UPI00301A86B2